MSYGSSLSLSPEGRGNEDVNLATLQIIQPFCIGIEKHFVANVGCLEKCSKCETDDWGRSQNLGTDFDQNLAVILFRRTRTADVQAIVVLRYSVGRDCGGHSALSVFRNFFDRIASNHAADELRLCNSQM